MSGSTLNPEYNDLLARRAADGLPSEPECEDCGCDLADKHVVDDYGTWVCESCSEADDSMFSADTVRAFEEGRSSWTR